VTKRVRELASSLQLRAQIPNEDAINKVVTIFRELRAGQTLDGKNKVKTPSGVLSTAEAISLLANSMALSGNFGDGSVSDHDLASGLQGAVIKDDEKDLVVWKDYLGNVMKKRGAAWRGLYTACQAHVGRRMNALYMTGRGETPSSPTNRFRGSMRQLIQHSPFCTRH
jgi:hypothetical protein